MVLEMLGFCDASLLASSGVWAGLPVYWQTMGVGHVWGDRVASLLATSPMLGMLGNCVASMLAIAIDDVWAGLPVYWQTMSVANLFGPSFLHRSSKEQALKRREILIELETMCLDLSFTCSFSSSTIAAIKLKP